MRKVGCLLGMVFLFSLTAAAQNAPKAEVFLGYSYVRARPSTSGASGINFHGGSGSLAYNATSSLGIVADFGGYRAGNIQGSGVDANVFTYLFGPRLSYRAYDRVARSRRSCSVARAAAPAFWEVRLPRTRLP